MKFYECEICGAIHRWEWDGDCREDVARLTFDDVGDNDELLSMGDRVAADLGGPNE